jgi:hypothetical protein
MFTAFTVASIIDQLYDGLIAHNIGDVSEEIKKGLNMIDTIVYATPVCPASRQNIAK